MPSGNLQIVNASQEDEGMYKCAAYNPVTQEVKTSGSSDRLRVRRKARAHLLGDGGITDGRVHKDRKGGSYLEVPHPSYTSVCTGFGQGEHLGLSQGFSPLWPALGPASHNTQPSGLALAGDCACCHTCLLEAHMEGLQATVLPCVRSLGLHSLHG